MAFDTRWRGTASKGGSEDFGRDRTSDDKERTDAPLAHRFEGFAKIVGSSYLERLKANAQRLRGCLEFGESVYGACLAGIEK